MVTTPYTMTDGKGRAWKFDSYGEIDSGNLGGISNGGSSSPYVYTSAPTLELSGRQLVYGPSSSSGVTQTRKVYVSDTEGFVRYMEILTNTGSTSVTKKITLSSTMSSYYPDVIRTSDSTSTFETADDWIVWDDADDAYLPNAHVIGGAYGLQPTAVTQSSSSLSYTYDVDLKPGETQVIMHFIAIGDTVAQTESIAKSLQQMKGDALEGLTDAELDAVVNFVPGETIKLKYDGTSSADVLVGDRYDEVFDGKGGNDVIYGDGGDDTIRGGTGNDTLLGGEGNDRVWGDTGSDTISGGAGDDELYGDSGSGLTTTSATNTVKSTGEKLSISLTLPDTSNDTSVPVTGFVSRTPVTSNKFNVAFVIDVSGSTSSTFSGDVTVGDKNGDGLANTVLDAEIAGFEALLAGITKQVGAENVNVAIIPFESSSWTASAGKAQIDTDGNGVSDAIQSLRSLDYLGGTNYAAGLQQTINFFKGTTEGQNLTFFLSDGEQNEGGDFTDEAAILLSKSGINSTIKSFGVGSNASQPQLDLVDDIKSNNSVQIVLNPADLSKVLIDPGISKTDVSKVELYVNGKLAQTIAGSKLTETPLGLSFAFDTVLKGLSATKDDKIIAKVIGADPDKTTVQTSQTIEVRKETDGADTIMGGDGSDFIWGGGGSDKLYGNDGSDFIYGESSSDKLYGGRGGDQLFGGSGNDLLDGGIGGDRMTGGTGDDKYYVDRSTDKVVELSGQGTDTVYSAVSYTLTSNVEKLILTGKAANGTGNSLANSITGNSSANKLKGEGGADTIKGEGGDDKLYGGSNNDKLYGGTGQDTLYGSTGKDTLYGDSNNDKLYGDSDDDKLYGGTGNDTLYGGTGIDTLYGDSGNDKLYGDSNNDKLYGSTGDDTLKGGSGNDTLSGSSDDDKLYGGSGNDTLTGGSGKDAFVFDTFQLVAADNVDKITDFSVKDDTIWLDKSVFTKLGALGVLASSEFRVGSSAADSSDNIIYNKTTGKLYYDTDGKGGDGHIQIASLSAGLALTHDDFLIM